MHLSHFFIIILSCNHNLLDVLKTYNHFYINFNITNMLKKNELMTYVVMMLFAFCGINTCYAGVMDDEVINMRHIGNHSDHFNFPMPAETPDVYFNNDIQLHIFISFTY